MKKKVTNYLSIVTHNEADKTASCEVKSEFKEEIISDIEEVNSSAEDWIYDKRKPFYKEFSEFLLTGAAGYFISVGLCEVMGIKSPDNKILASTIFSFLPYFAGRLIPNTFSIWNSKPVVECAKFKESIPSLIGSLGAAGVGTFFGSIKTFNAFSHRETALLGSVGLMSGRIIEGSIKYYSENKCCEKDPSVRLISR